MRDFDFTPFLRSVIGFDRVMDLMQNALSYEPGENYPPYDIEKTGEDAYRITMAVAGFMPEEISVVAEQNELIVTGRKQGEDAGQYLHRGIATRTFERHFELADFVQVTGATLENGMLSIELVREVPEEMKPHKVAIAAGARSPKAIEKKAA